jgi:hypothetical protein
MWRAFPQIDAKRPGAGSLRREVYSLGELPRGSLRARPRRMLTGALLLLGLGLLCAGVISGLWYLSRSSLPKAELNASQNGKWESEPALQVAKICTHGRSIRDGRTLT